MPFSFSSRDVIVRRRRWPVRLHSSRCLLLLLLFPFQILSQFAGLVAEFEESADAGDFFCLRLLLCCSNELCRRELRGDPDFGTMIELVGQESVMERLEQFMAEADDLGDDVLRIQGFFQNKKTTSFSTRSLWSRSLRLANQCSKARRCWA